jgi:hypothetical protein
VSSSPPSRRLGSLVGSMAGVLPLVVAVALWAIGECDIAGALAVLGIVVIGASDPPHWHGSGPAS